MLPSLLSTRARASEASYFRKGEQLGTQELRKTISKQELDKLREENKLLEERIRSGEFEGLPEILQNVWVPSLKPTDTPQTVQRPLKVPLKITNEIPLKKEHTLPTHDLTSSARLATDSYYDLTRGRYEYLKKWKDSAALGQNETVLSLSQKLRVEALGIGFRALFISTICTAALGCTIFLYLRPEERRDKLRERTQRFSENLKNWLKTPLSFISTTASDSVLDVDHENSKYKGIILKLLVSVLKSFVRNQQTSFVLRGHFSSLWITYFSWNLLLLPTVPLGLVLGWMGYSETWTFIVNFLAIIPLSTLLGWSFLLGGLFHTMQPINPAIADSNTSVLAVALFGFTIPAVFSATETELSKTNVQILSFLTAIFMFLLYLLFLVFELITHAHLYDNHKMIRSSSKRISEEDWNDSQTQELVDATSTGSLWLAVGIQLGTVILTSYCSEYLVHSIQGFSKRTKLSSSFVAFVLLPIVGNAAEHLAACAFAIKGNIDLSISIACGSSVQVALFVAPLLVISSWFMPGPLLTLDFHLFETVMLGIAVAVTSLALRDNTSNWLEGAELLISYAVISTAFFLK
ncbi:Ca(2+)/H(+) antiporter [Galdieria sulphuraria]|nr:Ca(2+)/H(+) antiporter [Galdieria sulphuraria]